MCAFLISTKGIEDMVAVHARSSRTSNRKELTVLSTCSTPARPWWAKLELLRGPVHMSARLAQATTPQSPPSVRQGHFGKRPVWQNIWECRDSAEARPHTEHGLSTSARPSFQIALPYRLI